MRFDTWGYLNHLACNWEWMKNSTLTAGVQVFGGNHSNIFSPDGMTLTYGDWVQNNRAFLSLKYDF
jgi:hypothetical protein